VTEGSKRTDGEETRFDPFPPAVGWTLLILSKVKKISGVETREKVLTSRRA